MGHRFSKEEETRLREVWNEYRRKMNEQREKGEKKLSPRMNEFMKECALKRRYDYQFDAHFSSELAVDLISGIGNGRYKKPS